jgi:4-hydroxymandelate oxidase
MVNTKDFEEHAARSLPKEVYEFLAGGSCDEYSIKANLKAFRRIELRPRVLVDVSRVDMTCTILGKTLVSPMIVAPMAFQKLAHPEGELAMARAAAASQIGYSLSLNATQSIEDVAKTAPGLPNRTNWFQLYVLEDRGLTKEIIERAFAAGHNGLIITTDRPVRGKRDRDIKNGFHIPKEMKPGNLPGGFAAGNTPVGGAFSGDDGTQTIDPSLSWRHLDWIRSVSKMPLILKGILHPLDAAKAVDSGVDAIIVSNHGARNLDGVIPPIEALGEVVDAVNGRAEIVVDGGIRRGTDILKALALGARAVLIGRPLLWGLAVSGETGVKQVIDILNEELRIAMSLTGCASLAGIKPDILYRRNRVN